MRNKILPLLFIGFALYQSRYKIISLIKPKHIPDALVRMGSCEKKKLCGIVYFAPWCPACHQYQPLIKELLTDFKNNNEHGLVVVMGMETVKGDNERIANEIDESVVIDDDKFYASKLNITYFPTFLVVNDKKKIILKDAEALQWLQMH